MRIRFEVILAIITTIGTFSALAAEQELIADMTPGDGKAFVRSEPAGGEIFIKKGGELLRTKVKTPGVINPKKGKVTVLVRLPGYEDGISTFQVEDGFAKPDVVKLKAVGKPVHTDVSTGDEFDWSVFIDDKPVKDINGRDAKTPCSLVIPEGAKTIAVAKEGYLDQRTYISKDKAKVEFHRRPMKGTSRLLSGSPLKTGKGKLRYSCVATAVTDGKASMLNNGNIGDSMDGIFALNPVKLKFNFESSAKVETISLYPFLHRDGAVCAPSVVKVYAATSDKDPNNASSDEGYKLVKEFSDSRKYRIQSKK